MHDNIILYTFNMKHTRTKTYKAQSLFAQVIIPKTYIKYNYI